MFHKSKAIAPAPAALPEAQWEIRVLNEKRRAVQDLGTELEAANTAMRAFRAEHMVLLGTQLCYRCSEITARASLDQQWHELVVRRDELLRRWNTALAEYATLKT
jgi:lipase chaperone LimK